MNKQEFETLINHGLVTDVQYADYMFNTSDAMSEINATKLAEMEILSQPQVNEAIIKHGIGVLNPSLTPSTPPTPSVPVIDTEEKLVEAITKGGEVTLGGDIVLSNYIEIRDKEVSINLNGHKITHPASSKASYKDVFEVYGSGKLVVEGKGQLIAEDGYCIYATGDSNVELNDGHYFSVVTAVDARKNAIVTINGGEFKVEGVSNSDGDYGQKYTLNLRDKKGNYAEELANFIVKGGKFFKFDPAASEAEPTVTNFVAEGYKSVADGDWFKVVKA